MGAALEAADHHGQLPVRIAALHRHDRCRGVVVPQVQRRLSALPQHARDHHRARADRLHPLPADAAPAPRLVHGMHTGFVDTLERYPTFWSFDSGPAARISNQYAAMPSVHIAWSTWCALALVPRVKTRTSKILAASLPGAHAHRDRHHREPLRDRRGRRPRDPRRSGGWSPTSSRRPAEDRGSRPMHRRLPITRSPDRPDGSRPRTRVRTASCTAWSANDSCTPRAVIEREPAGRHPRDPNRANLGVIVGNRGLGQDRHAGARRDEVGDEPDSLDLDRDPQLDVLGARRVVDLVAQRVALRRKDHGMLGERRQRHRLAGVRARARRARDRRGLRRAGARRRAADPTTGSVTTALASSRSATSTASRSDAPSVRRNDSAGATRRISTTNAGTSDRLTVPTTPRVA